MKYKRRYISKQMENVSGQRFNRLIALYPVENPQHRGIKWKFKCDCGNYTYNLIGNVKRGRVQSCGCLHMEKISQTNYKKHGMYKTSVYSSWSSMKSRCYDKNNSSYKNYGGRGIKVLDRWRKFENFYKDMGDKPKGKTLDRIDNDGDYKPENCRWATWKQQANNRRSCHFITINGIKKTIKDWSKYLNVNRRNIYRKFGEGWSDQKTIKHFIRLRGEQAIFNTINI